MDRARALSRREYIIIYSHSPTPHTHVAATAHGAARKTTDVSDDDDTLTRRNENSPIGETINEEGKTKQKIILEEKKPTRNKTRITPMTSFDASDVIEIIYAALRV